MPEETPNQNTDQLLSLMMQNQDEQTKDTNGLLEGILQHMDENKSTTILESTLAEQGRQTEQLIKLNEKGISIQAPEVQKISLEGISVVTLKGDTGDKGEKGDKGDTGNEGKQGPAGLDGKDGVNGLNGKDGINGTDGKDGDIGPIGPQGDKGDKGDQGTPGYLNLDKFIGEINPMLDFSVLKNRPMFTGKGGGANYLRELSDVNLTGLVNGQSIKWDTTTNKWIVYTPGSGGGGGTWGTITGTLSDQTDLQSALDAKLSSATAATTYLKLDQTTPQTIVSGAPIFNAGLTSNALATFNHNFIRIGVTGNDIPFIRFGDGTTRDVGYNTLTNQLELPGDIFMPGDLYWNDTGDSRKVVSLSGQYLNRGDGTTKVLDWSTADYDVAMITNFANTAGAQLLGITSTGADITALDFGYSGGAFTGFHFTHNQTAGSEVDTIEATEDLVITAPSYALSTLTSNGFVKTTGSDGTLVIDTSTFVTSVSGTTNRITSTGGATPVIDISASYVGQSSITTLGTIATGVWNGTDIPVTAGGTGLSAISALSIWLANSANTITEVTPGAGNSIRINAGGTAWEAYTPGSGGGDVTKVGTPVDNQVAIWTGDGTVEGDVDMTFDSTSLTLGNVAANLIMGTSTLSSTATPTKINMGGTFANTVVSSKAKLQLYNDGTAANNYGVGVSNGRFNLFAPAAAAHSFIYNDVVKLNVFSATSGVQLALTGSLTTGTLLLGDNNSLSTATPVIIDGGGTFADTVVGSKAKYKLFNNGTSNAVYGLGISSGQFNFFKSASGSYRWYFAEVEKAQLTDSGFGIKTTPNVALQVSVDGSAPSAVWYTSSDAFVASNINADTIFRIGTGSATANESPAYVANRSRGTVASPTVVQSGDRVMRINGNGYDGSAMRAAGQILMEVDGTPGSSDMPGRILFLTTPDASATPAERMRIDSAGDITIADTSDFIFNTTTGTKFGTATTQKISFWNKTPIVQPAAANQAALTNSTTGSYDGTLVDVGVVFSQAAINDNFTDVYTLLTEIRTALVNVGIIKGAA